MKKTLSYTLLAVMMVMAPMPLPAAEKLPANLGKMYDAEVIQVAAKQTDVIRSRKEPLRLAQTEIPAAPPAVGGELAIPAESGDPVISSTPIELFACVEYEDKHNIHPCAVTKIVAVKHPGKKKCHKGFLGLSCGRCNLCCDTCNSCGSCDSCCDPGCVYIQICVPPCDCADVKISRNGAKVKYDYGEYEVEIKSKDGIVKVDYDD